MSGRLSSLGTKSSDDTTSTMRPALCDPPPALLLYLTNDPAVTEIFREGMYTVFLNEVGLSDSQLALEGLGYVGVTSSLSVIMLPVCRIDLLLDSE
jgi:hypothetical protein